MGRPRTPLLERFWAKVEKREGCWRWHGAKSQGYGYINRGGRGEGIVKATRYSYEIHKGPIPDGFLVRHKCDNPECTNPEHLELGTNADNSRDIVLRRRHATHGQTNCLNGHEYNEENTYYNKRGHKYCKVCKREASAAKLREKRGDKFGKQEWKPKTHCPHGHEFTPSNTYIRPDGYKECRACRVERIARFKAKQNG